MMSERSEARLQPSVLPSSDPMSRRAEGGPRFEGIRDRDQTRRPNWDATPPAFRSQDCAGFVSRLLTFLY